MWICHASCGLYGPTFIALPITTEQMIINDEDTPFVCYWPGCDFAVESALSLISTTLCKTTHVLCVLVFSFHHIHQSDHITTHKVGNASNTIVGGDTVSLPGSSAVETDHDTAGIRMDVYVFVVCL